MMLPVTGVAPLTAAELVRARNYLYGDLLAGTLAQVGTLALLALAYWSGVAARLEGALARRWRRRWVVTAGVTAALIAGVEALLLPFSIYLGYVREREFGFERMPAGAWLGQWAVSVLVTVAAAVLVVAVAWGWLRRPRGPRWWVKLWVVVAAGVVFGVAIDPILIEPLFNHFTPVRDAAVRADLSALAARAGIPHASIEEMDASRQSGHTNAYVVGILGSQRIVVYDTLLAAQPRAEIEFVVGHEIGHYVLHHLWKGVGFTLLFLLGVFAVAGALVPRWSRGEPIAAASALPLVLLVVLGVVYLAAPLTNGFARWEEHQADVYGLRLSGQPCAAVASFEREEHTDLIYPDPPEWVVAWFFNHPSQQERIDYAARYCISGARGAAAPGAAPHQFVR